MPNESDQELFEPLRSWQVCKDAGVRADLVPCRVRDFDEDRNAPNTLAYEASANGIERFAAYAAAYRYPTASGRIKQTPPAFDIDLDLQKVATALQRAATQFGIDLATHPSRTEPPASASGRAQPPGRRASSHAPRC